MNLVTDLVTEAEGDWDLVKNTTSRIFYNLKIEKQVWATKCTIEYANPAETLMRISAGLEVRIV